jgi:SNF2 family DNA or RNA helicase
MDIKELVGVVKLRLQAELSKEELSLGEIIFNNNECHILSQSAFVFDLIVDVHPASHPIECRLEADDMQTIIPITDGELIGWSRFSYACLLQIEHELALLNPKEHFEHKKYSRAGMKRRVLLERCQKADKANYRIKWANNIYGNHVLTNENGVRYTVFLRDFDRETGYSDSMDARFNKLGTSKHIIFAFRKLKEDRELFEKLDKTYPFVEVFLDPLNDYKITWHYPQDLPVEEKLLISRYFKKKKYIEEDEITNFLGFLDDAEHHNAVLIRPEVREKVEAAFEKASLDELSNTRVPDFTLLKATLFDYQKEGIRFGLFKKAAIIADEMGLGKTLQAIGVAVNKKEIFGFRKTLIVCPASLKDQWKKEIERFSNEKALVIQGSPEERENQYNDKDHFFFIVNYETILRDQRAIDNADIDFLILDEAQRAKNFETKTAASVKKLQTRHILVITGTPIENRLIDLFSIMSILDPTILGPLWEFSYKYCLFDPEKPNKINGYYNLQKLKSQVTPILLRREKRNVLDQLPNISQVDVPINLSPLQADYHASFAKGVASIIRKKFLTPYDLKRLQLLLANMRMVCDSTFLIDKETYDSPKLEELKYILIEQLDVKNSNKKIIIFSEWVIMHKLIGNMLRENNIGFAELNGSVPVKLRGELIRGFESNPDCKVFLSTEAGGSGLNLQVADTLINFELPWNPAKKNQRIGRIDRIGQRSKKLTILNLITRRSIEQQIAAGLMVKQSLFDGVLDGETKTNFVDFSTKGRAQFIQQLEEFIASIEEKVIENEEDVLAPVSDIAKEKSSSEIPSAGIAPSGELVDLSGDEPGSDSEMVSKGEIAEAKAGSDGSAASTDSSGGKDKASIQAEEFEAVMNNGLMFLSGLLKMSTGKELGIENQKIEVNRETGEVIMRFKMPF